MPSSRRRRAPSYLQQRGRRWYAVMEIPGALRPRFSGKPRFVQSLGTESRSQAEHLVHEVVAGWKYQLTEPPWPAEVGRRGSYPRPSPLALFQQLRRPRDEEERQLILDEIERHAWDIGAINVEHVGDRPSSDPEARRYHAIATGGLAAFDAHLEPWLATWDVADKTKDMARGDVAAFAKRFPTTADVTRKGVTQWVADRVNKDGVSEATVARSLTALRQYWRYLETVEAVSEDYNPFDGLRRNGKARGAPRSSREPFDPADVVKLLRVAIEGGDDELADLIRLGMWTGARIEELCSLKVADVTDSAFTVKDAKTSAGRREIPIHPELRQTMTRLIEGKRPRDYVLVKLTVNKYGDRSGAVGKRFGRLKKRLGFGPAHVFHSIRKTVTTQLENAGVPENVTADLLGHQKPRITYGVYSGGTSLVVKAKALARVRYPTA